MKRVAPTVFAVGATALVALPLVGLVHEFSWTGFRGALQSEPTRQALFLSLFVSSMALLVSAVIGLPIAWLLARRDFPGRDLVRTVVLVPLVLPPVVAGLALVKVFGARGLIGSWVFEHTGYRMVLTPTAAIVAAAFVSMPLLIVSAEAAFRSLDREIDDTAATLGARPAYRFFRVVIPSVRPGLAAGAALCFARALGEYGATALFAGNLAGKTQTMTLLIYDSAAIGDMYTATTLSLVLLLVSVCLMYLLRDRWRPER